MSTVTTQSLRELVANALERMAFVFTDASVVTADEFLGEPAAHATIDLAGASPRTICVSATPGMVKDIASGMLGCEPEQVDFRVHGVAAVCELANVFGGEMVQRLSVDGAVFSIGLPREVAVDEVRRLVADAAGRGAVTVVGSELGELMVAVSA